MILLVIILVIIIGILLSHIIFLRKELRSIAYQMEYNKAIRINTLNSEIENIACRINNLYEENNKVNIKAKRLEDEMKQSISNMTHDLRTPLTSITGYIQLIKSKSISDIEKDNYIDIIEKRANNLRELVSSFYEMSTIESGEYRLSLVKVNLKESLYDLLALYYNDFLEKDVKVDIEVEDNIKPILLDESMVNRILLNLISNMIKHSRDYIKIHLKKEGDKIVSFFINPSGSIKNEDVEKLFNRCFTMDESRSSQNTGLGLFISKTLIERLGGNIEGKVKNNELIIRIIWNS